MSATAVGAGAAGTSGRRAARAGDLAQLEAGLARRDARSVARAISLVEDGGATQAELVGRLARSVGRARVVGVTGPPGAGKSTLVDRMAHLLRARGATVGILCVDPTSPFSGGAILGDRIRMQAIATDPGVFIRSMATRGAMGGLARATRDAADVLDAAGFDWILVETVGVGQDEVDVVSAVDSVLVVAVPGLGDDIQAIKAGVLEIADVFVLNKADRDGADRVVRDLQMMLSLGEHGAWVPPIVRTVAMRGEGVEEVLAALERHHQHLAESGELARRRREQLRLRVETILKERVVSEARSAGELARAIDAGFAGHLDPYSVAARLFEDVVRHDRHGPTAAAGAGGVR